MADGRHFQKKPLNRHIAIFFATVRPVLMKFGTMTHIGHWPQVAVYMQSPDVILRATLRLDVCTGTVFQSHPRLYLHPLHPPSPAPVPSVIHPHPSTYQFLSVPTPTNPVDVVPQPRTILATLTAAGHRRNVVFLQQDQNTVLSYRLHI